MTAVNNDGFNRAQAIQRLTQNGYSPNDLANYSDEQVFRLDKAIPQDTVVIANKSADTEAQAAHSTANQKKVDEVNEMKKEAAKQQLAFHYDTDPEFEAKCKTLAEARAKFDELQAQQDLLHAQSEKLNKKSLTFSKKAKETKHANREKATALLSNNRAELAKARTEMLQAEKAFVNKEGKFDEKLLKAANEFLLRQAEKHEKEVLEKFNKEYKDPDKLKEAIDAEQVEKNKQLLAQKNKARANTQRAARHQADTYFDRSEEGKKAKLDNAKIAARGSLDKNEALTKKERKERARNGYADEIGGTSVRYASLEQKRNERNYQQLLKEEALQKIIIGDKDAYKAAKKADKDKDYPTVTYMSEKTYKAAREFAASKGVELPEYKKGQKLELTGQQMKAYQQVMKDAASDFGDRADISERKTISNKFRNIKFTTTDNMFRAANIDVQMRHNTAAAVGSLVATAATGGALGFTEVVGKVADAVLPDFGGILNPGSGGLGNTSHVEGAGEKLLKGSDGVRKFKWKNVPKDVGVGVLCGALIKAMDHEIGLLKRGKTLEDVVYNSLDVPAFKSMTPNAKKKMAKFLATDNLSSEQKLAILEKTMGTGKLNPRELAAAVNQIDKYNPHEDTPTLPLKITKRTRYIIKDGYLVDDKNKKMEDKDLIDIYGNPYEIKGTGAQGTAVDEKTSARSGKMQKAADVDFTYNPNNPTDISQIIISDDDGEVTDIIGDNVKDPDEFTLNDNSNKQLNSYKFKKLTKQEMDTCKLKPENGPFYKLVFAKNDKGDPITQSEGKVFKYSFTKKQDVDVAYVKNDQNEIIEQVYITKITPQYRLDAVTNPGESSSIYLETGATPKVKKA